MAKTADTASLLESSRKALAQLEQEISALEVTRDERLLANEPTAKITAVDKELENSRRAAGIERDRIRLFEDRLDRDRSAARLGQRLERVQAVEQLLQTRDAAGRDLVAAIESLDVNFHKLLDLAAEIRASWNFKLIDCGPVLISETAISDAVSGEMWRILGRSPVTGGMPSGPANFSFPNLKAPSFAALGNPAAAPSFQEALQKGSALASQILRQGATTGASEPAAAVGPSGRSLGVLLGEAMRLADLPQTEQVEKEYFAVLDEVRALQEGQAA